MSDKPEKAEGAHPAPDGHSGAGDPWSGAPIDEELWAQFERPAGYRGHSSSPIEAPSEPVAPAGDTDATHLSDPYDYGAPRAQADGDPRQPGLRGGRPPMPPGDDQDAAPVLDRELLARELAADRARSARPPLEPTSEVPRAPSLWPNEGLGGAHLRRPPSASPTPGTGPALSSGAGLDPRQPLASSGASHWPSAVTGEHRPTVPFTPSGSFPVTEAEKLERVFDAAYRWRTLLALGLASILTLGVVLAYRPDGDESTTDEVAARNGEADSDDVTDFPSTTTPVTVDPQGTQDVGSAVDGIETTTTGASTGSSSAGTSPDDDGEPAATATTRDDSDPDPDPAPTDPPASPSTTSAPEITSSTSAPAPTEVEFQAETLTITAPARVRSDHEGFTGTGYVSEIIDVGAGAGRTVRSLSTGTMRYTIRYATPEPPNGPEGTRTLSIEVDGALATTVSFPPSGGVTTWLTVSGTFELAEGDHTIAVVMAEGDTGWVNIDSITLSSL